MRYRYYSDPPGPPWRYENNLAYYSVGKESQYIYWLSYRDETFRTIFSKDVSTINSGAIAKKATVKIKFSLEGNNIAKNAQLVSFPSGPWITLSGWDVFNSSNNSVIYRENINTGITTVQDIVFSRNNVNDVPFLNAISSAIGNQYFNFCVRLPATDETNNLTRANIELLSLNIEWEAKDVTVKNNFDGGKFKTDNDLHENVPEAGIVFQWLKNSTHNLLAYDNQTPPDGYTRSFNIWRKDDNNWGGDGILSASTDLVTAITKYEANFSKLFEVTITEAQFVETGSGGTYNVTTPTGYFPNVASWNGTYRQNSQTPIILEAVPPNSDYFLLQWSDGNTSNPRNLTPADHVYGLHAIFKKHLASSTIKATGSNAEAKLTRHSDGDLYLTYESGNNIYTTHSSDFTDWTNETSILSQGGAAIRRGSSTTYTDIDQIKRTVYEVVADAEGMTEHQIVAIEGSYVIQIASFSADATFEATPIITYGTMPERDNVICVVWSQPDGIFLATKYHRQHYYTEPIVIIDRHDVSTPSIAMEKITTGEQNNAPDGYYFHCVWKQEREIIYRKGHFRIGESYVQLEWDYSTTYEITREHPELVHAGNPVVTLYQENTTNLNSSVPHIFFDAIVGDNPNKNENHSIFYTTQYDGHWTELVQFIHHQELGVFHDEQYPSAVVEQNNILRCVWQCNNHLMNITRELPNGEWSEAGYIGGDESIGKDGKYPNLFYDALFDNTTYAVWGAENENLYSIRTYQFSNSLAKNKETTTDVTQIRRGSVQIEDYKIGNDGVLNGGLWVTMY
ncbi:MAG: hypothetical protein AAB071_02765, partial [Bacteroidota bacterium]